MKNLADTISESLQEINEDFHKVASIDGPKDSKGNDIASGIDIAFDKRKGVSVVEFSSNSYLKSMALDKEGVQELIHQLEKIKSKL